MKKIISKTILARWPAGGLLEDDFFTSIKENLGIGSRYNAKKDDGINDKITVLPQTGFGPESRGVNPGAGSSFGNEDEKEKNNNSLSSGYNDGGQADDETGPGQTSTSSNPYLLNELFLDLDMKSGGRDKISGHLDKILKGQGMSIPHKRHAVN